jgi:predicted NAD/FAD-dependent oxidoreductase
MSEADRPRACVIGGGLAGLTAASDMARSGWNVIVFDKARGPGGRMSLRRVEHPDLGTLAFSHGATFFQDADSPDFARAVAHWQDQGLVRPWQGRVCSFGPDREPRVVDSDTRRWVGVPGMNAVAKHLVKAGEFDYRPRHHARGLLHDGRHWSVAFDDQTADGFDAAVIACPPKQAAMLLRRDDPLGGLAASIEMRPTWAVMLAYGPGDEPASLREADAAFVHGGGIAWLFRGSSDRDGVAGWTLHLGYEWSEARLESDAGTVSAEAVEQFTGLFGGPPPTHVAGHRWRYVCPRQPAGRPCLLDTTRRLAICGDWCVGSTVGAAWRSGRSAAQLLSLSSTR